jgi:hypothetical protein
MTSSRALEAHYEIIETRTPEDGRFQYIVKDHSSFDKYMAMEPPKMLVSIIINDSNRFEKFYVDTLPGYNHYDRRLSEQFKVFDEWLKQHYPDDMLKDLLQDQTGQLVARLKEYSAQTK